MSWINAGEVAYVVERAAGAERAREVIAELRGRLVLELPHQERILAAARIKARHAMAYADAFACATSLAHGSLLLTGDPEILAARDLGLSVTDLRTG
ncbi:MAG: ribonuclease VapC [Miltoncostaeaceae bacterium]|jgi:predicted nucleic acid-binding protein|nr:ribonuclease VapC [Miltoncostaeaceae bacterium]